MEITSQEAVSQYLCQVNSNEGEKHGKLLRSFYCLSTFANDAEYLGAAGKISYKELRYQGTDKAED